MKNEVTDSIKGLGMGLLLVIGLCLAWPLILLFLLFGLIKGDIK